MASFYEFRKKKTNKEAQCKNHRQRISSLSTLVIHTFVDSFRNNKILKVLMKNIHLYIWLDQKLIGRTFKKTNKLMMFGYANFQRRDTGLVLRYERPQTIFPPIIRGINCKNGQQRVVVVFEPLPSLEEVKGSIRMCVTLYSKRKKIVKLKYW